MSTTPSSDAAPDYPTVSFWYALAPVVILIALLFSIVWIFGDDATSGPSQVALIIAGFVTAAFAWVKRVPWVYLERQVLASVGYVAQAIFILLLVGALIGTWILGGIVPALIVWGLRILSPEIFLAAATIIAALVSLATGSSWSTAGTLGLAMIGIGDTMQIHPGLTAGAVVSGAYFGDKMSPFSETTNLAASMAGVDLFVHIRHMLYTTGPSMIIATILFAIIGVTSSTDGYDPARIDFVIRTIDAQFDTGLHMFLPPLILFVLVARRTPAIPALFFGSVMGALWAFIFQADVVLEFAGGGASYIGAAARATIQAAATGFVPNLTGDADDADQIAAVASLLERGGMSSMLTTVWLILSAMFFSGVMEGAGFLQRLAAGILSVAKGTGNLIAATLGTALFLNTTASEQYLSVVLTGRMYADAYDREGLHPKNLSRAIEDSGTLTSALVPWNTCGAFMASTLGVATLTYLPFAFLNWINPLIALILGYAGIGVAQKDTSHPPPVGGSSPEGGG